MTKQITITLNDYVFNSCFNDFDGNRSQRLETLILLGIETETGNVESHKQRIITQNNIINDLQQKVRKLNLTIEGLKNKIERDSGNDLTDNEKFAKAYKNRGLMG